MVEVGSRAILIVNSRPTWFPGLFAVRTDQLYCTVPTNTFPALAQPSAARDGAAFSTQHVIIRPTTSLVKMLLLNLKLITIQASSNGPQIKI
jgi:hypothetical protein